MENYDPQFAARTQAGDVVVGGFNFGTGSSREQAVTALKCTGIPLVIAGSFSQTYLRNAFNNGFLCIEAPELVKRPATRSFEDRHRAQGEERSSPATRSRSISPPARFATAKSSSRSRRWAACRSRWSSRAASRTW